MSKINLAVLKKENVTKTFSHCLYQGRKFERVDVNGARHYDIDGLYLPSVTTVLSGTKDHSFLDNWKAKVGDDAAAKITAQSADVGTQLHKLCEDYTMNQPLVFDGVHPKAVQLFRSMQRILNDHVDRIVAVEAELYSLKYRYAGTVDSIAAYDNLPAVIDYKNSRKQKSPGWIKDYHLQVALYAQAFLEMTGKRVRLGRILIANWDTMEVDVFKTDPWANLEEALYRVQQYHLTASANAVE